MKKVIIAAIIFVACQCIAVWLISGIDSIQGSDEVDMEIYDVEFEGHSYLIFKEYWRTINVLHDPNCKCNEK